jgi:hypothetical protein
VIQGRRYIKTKGNPGIQVQKKKKKKKKTAGGHYTILYYVFLVNAKVKLKTKFQKSKLISPSDTLIRNHGNSMQK